MSSWQILSAAFVSLAMGLTFLGLSRLPNTRMARPLLGFALCGAFWVLGEMVTLFAANLGTKQTGIALLYTGAIFMAPMWWALALRWADGYGVSLRRLERLARASFVWAALMWLAMLTNPWHGQFLTPVIGARNVYRPLFWAMTLPNYGFIFAAGAAVVATMQRVPLLRVRRQGGAMLAASSLLALANISYVFGLTAGINATLFVLGTSASILVVFMYREGLFGVLPIALPVVAEHDPDGLVIVRIGGRVAWANSRAHELLPATLSESAPFPGPLRHKLERASGSHASEPDEDDGRWWQEVLAPGGQRYRIDGAGERWLHLMGQTVRRPGRGLAALCVRVRDVTDEQQTQTELRRAHRLQSVAELSRGVAHDFRNMVSIVRGNAELLVSDLPDDPRIQKRLASILNAGERATDLAKQLQLYAGGVDPIRQPTELSELVREAAEMQDSLLGFGQKLEIEVHPEPVVVEIDATQVHQSVTNLIVNARESLGEEAGTILVRTGLSEIDPAHMSHLVLGRERPSGTYAWVRVADNGPGIDAAAQERIFEPFFSTKGKRGGIGLSTVLGIARAHEAVVQLESALERGSSFSLYFRAED